MYVKYTPPNNRQQCRLCFFGNSCDSESVNYLFKQNSFLVISVGPDYYELMGWGTIRFDKACFTEILP